MVTVTDAGLALRDRAVRIPEAMAACSPLTPEEGEALYRILYRLLGKG